MADQSALWISAQEAHEAGELRIFGFEPCYIVCIKDLERRISISLAESVGNGHGVDVPGGLEVMLLQHGKIYYPTVRRGLWLIGRHSSTRQRALDD